MTDSLTITAFEPRHIPGALRLSQEASWPHTADDWAFALNVSRGVAALEGGRVVGTALCSEFGDFVTINMIIVDARLRGRGLGRRLMNEVLAIGGTRGMTLCATEDGRPLYEKLGFVAYGEITQFQGIATDVPQGAAPALTLQDKADLGHVIALDRKAYGADRSRMLTRLAETGRIYAGEAGFVAIRDFGRGQVIGPVVAQDADTAWAMIAAVAEAGRFLRVDTTPATGLADRLTAIGLVLVGGGTAMYKAPARQAEHPWAIFALANQAIG